MTSSSISLPPLPSGSTTTSDSKVERTTSIAEALSLEGFPKSFDEAFELATAYASDKTLGMKTYTSKKGNRLLVIKQANGDNLKIGKDTLTKYHEESDDSDEVAMAKKEGHGKQAKTWWTVGKVAKQHGIKQGVLDTIIVPKYAWECMFATWMISQS